MQSGDRVFTKAEWACLGAAVNVLRHWIENDLEAGREEPHGGIAAFDALSSGQKLLILTDTSEALVLADVPAPDHTAANEGTIAAMFAMLQTLIDGEVEANHGTTLRRALLAAMADEPDLPSANSDDLDEWELLVECFADRVLWDSHYAMLGAFMDLPPDESTGVNDHLGVSGDEYFLAVVRTPPKAELEALSRRLQRLITTAG